MALDDVNKWPVISTNKFQPKLYMSKQPQMAVTKWSFKNMLRFPYKRTLDSQIESMGSVDKAYS